MEAVVNKHLVHWLDNGFVRTLEPHAFAQLLGGRSVLLAFQIAGGPALEQPCWKVVDATDPLTIDAVERFALSRQIPLHLQSLVQMTYASAAPSEFP
jgi:hypothetical protein